MTVTTKHDIVFCQCGCGLTLLAIDAFWGDDDEPYLSYDHLNEAQQSQYLERYDYYEELPDGN